MAKTNKLHTYTSTSLYRKPSSSPPLRSATASLYSTSTSTSTSRSPYLSRLSLLRYWGSGTGSLPPPASSSSSDPPLTSSSSPPMYLSQSDALRYADSAAAASTSAASHLASWLPPPPGVDITSAAVDSLIPGLKRSSDVLYHPTILGAHTAIGQTDAWYTANSLAKRTRIESASYLPIYPQRPGEKDCAHYMLTRTCKFGDSCKFDHPVWVPEGGIPDWKEVPVIATGESLPERPGEPDCPYFLKTQRCMYGPKCKFNHPKDKLVLGAAENTDASALPERPSEPPCAFYVKTGKCKFGATCKFNHPKDILMRFSGNEVQAESSIKNEGTSPISFSPAIFHNTKGLPIRLGEVDCPFYMKTGSCKYGASCRYNHPDRSAINPLSAVNYPIVASPSANLNIGIANPVASLYQTFDTRLAQSMLGVGSTIFPQRPGHTECDFYMKTGICKFGERCRFHHPIDRSAPSEKQAEDEEVKLTLAGLPRREGSIHCPYYMKTGTCKYGASCKFDHPPPGEVMATTSSQGKSELIETLQSQ